MKHPSSEEWMSYFYDETDGGARAELAEHLRDCAECAAKVADWQAARQQLTLWRLPARRRRVAVARPALQWAAAAAILLSIGFAAGSWAAARNDRAQSTAALAAEVQQQLRSTRAEWQQEFARSLRRELDQATAATLAAASEQTDQSVADFVRTLEARRVEEAQATYAALEKLETQRAVDYLALKKDLDTVALNTDAGLRHTEQQLIQLADYSQPAGGSTPIQRSSP